MTFHSTDGRFFRCGVTLRVVVLRAISASLPRDAKCPISGYSVNLAPYPGLQIGGLLRCPLGIRIVGAKVALGRDRDDRIPALLHDRSHPCCYLDQLPQDPSRISPLSDISKTPADVSMISLFERLPIPKGMPGRSSQGIRGMGPRATEKR
jgi:hypothetical protein